MAVQSRNYAKIEFMDKWLRHPVLGDPSFDSFEKFGESVHISDEKYPWAVNGSLFCDPKDGAWYLYCGLYNFGYAFVEGNPPIFVIYRSRDGGKSWEYLGEGFERGFQFACYDVPVWSYPDVFVCYDDASDLYYLSYDFSNSGWNWSDQTKQDSGCALAYAGSPAGPFTPFPTPSASNSVHGKKIGRFSRLYASTVIKRKNDWINFILCDSASYFSWGYIVMTAPAPDGAWSDPVIVLSVDREEYYPAPVEFHPAFTHDGKVYAPATSVARNRNYQAVFCADLEQAHLPSAWKLCHDGNFWHSRPIEKERYGIWGQTISGFVKDGLFTVMYPAKDERNWGTIQIAQRKWDVPHTDGFTLSGHDGKSISPLLCAYRDFTLTATFDFTGTAEFAFDYGGILGPDSSTSDACPSADTLRNYTSLKVCENGSFALMDIDAEGTETVHFAGNADGGAIRKITLSRKGDTVSFSVNGETFEDFLLPVDSNPAPIALICHRFSVLNCTDFTVSGEVFPYTLQYNAYDALLGGGQTLSDWKVNENGYFISQTPNICKAKWNVVCDGFTIRCPVGKMAVSADGNRLASLKAGESFTTTLPYGRHGITVRPVDGDILAIKTLTVRG